MIVVAPSCKPSVGASCNQSSDFLGELEKGKESNSSLTAWYSKWLILPERPEGVHLQIIWNCSSIWCNVGFSSLIHLILKMYPSSPEAAQPRSHRVEHFSTSMLRCTSSNSIKGCAVSKQSTVCSSQIASIWSSRSKIAEDASTRVRKSTASPMNVEWQMLDSRNTWKYLKK